MTVRDVQAAGLCLNGMRRWFSTHDLDFRTAVREGVPLETVERLAEHDHYARQVLEAHERRRRR